MVLDPVFVEASPARLAFARECLSLRPAVLRLNAAEFAARLDAMTGHGDGAAEVEASVSRLFTYAAWADKYDGAVHNVPIRGVALAMHEAIGVVGVLTRRNALVLFMCVELMLNAVNLTFVALSRLRGGTLGQAFVVFVMTVAAAEAAVGLAIVIAVFRHFGTVDLADIRLLRG